MATARCARWRIPPGVVTDTYDHDAFGNLINSTGTTPNNYLFAGEQFDPDLHLYYNRARCLNTSTGRFWSMDTDEGDDESPLSLHKYLYGLADPVDNLDRDGNEVDEIAAGAISQTLDTMPSLSLAREEHAALPIPPYPCDRGTATYWADLRNQERRAPEESSRTKSWQSAKPSYTKRQVTQASPKYNEFGDGTLWGAIKTGSVAVGSPG